MPPRYLPEKKQLFLGVSDLLWMEELSSPHFSSVPQRSLLGQKIHQQHAQTRILNISGYESEVSVFKDIYVDSCKIRISGRIDGLWQENKRWIVEEVKSISTDKYPLPYQSHMIQCVIYIWLLSFRKRLPVSGVVTVINPFNNKTYQFPVEPDIAQVEQLVRERISKILEWFRSQNDHIEQIAMQSTNLQWPYNHKRSLQVEMCSTIETFLQTQSTLMLEAPTGSGKSAPVLFKTLKHCLKNRMRLAVSTSRNAQQMDRVNLFKQINCKNILLRIVVYGSLETYKKLCNHSLFNSDRTFSLYDPPEWFRELMSSETTYTPELIAAISSKHNFNPITLQSAVLAYADILIGDINLFVSVDRNFLHRREINNYKREWVFAGDEAHGIPDRLFSNLQSELKICDIRKALSKTITNHYEQQLTVYLKLTYDMMKMIFEEFSLSSEATYQEIDSFPDGFHPNLETVKLLLSYIERENPGSKRSSFLENITKALFALQNPSVFACYLDLSKSSLNWIPVNTGSLINSQLQEFSIRIYYSATLSPCDSYTYLLGADSEDLMSVVFSDESSNERKMVLRYDSLDTRYHSRESTLDHLEHLLKKLNQETRFSWAVFFPSNAYMNLVQQHMKIMGYNVFAHSSNVPPRLSRKLLQGATSIDYHFLIMGGKYSEGIDLPDSINGIVIVGPALPPPTPHLQLLTEKINQDGQNGTLLTNYLPAARKIIQSAGRIVRRSSQVGVVILADKRFSSDEFMQLFPESWSEIPPLNETDKLIDLINNWYSPDQA